MIVRFTKFIFLFVGIALLVAVLIETDLDELWIAVSRVGVLGMMTVMLVYALYFGADAISWQITLPAVDINRPWIGRMFVVRMIGEAYNNITPTASLGGEPIKAWLLKVNWGVPLRESGASLVIAKTTSMFSLVIFVAVGVFMMFGHPEVTAAHKSVAVWGLSVIIIAAIVFFLMQHLKLSTFVARKLGRSRFQQRLAGVIRAVEDIDHQFASFYSEHGVRLWWSSLFAMANWVLGVVEVYLIMDFIGYPASFAEAWMIECMVQLVRTVTFFIPAGLGTQEGAFLIGVGVLTGAPSAGVATALVRRCRDLIWIGLSLFLATFYSVTPARVAREELDSAD
ncbi:MAG: flippase-like domain-containing protein [Proteobacteria bacterium]|nr:flippase-like domain-containing protein [Pseudomonadota bacterium]